MSASLTYVTPQLPESMCLAVREFTRQETAGYQWWAESLNFFDDPKRPGQLVGNTKLFRLIDDPAADSFMASAHPMAGIWCSSPTKSTSLATRKTRT